MSHGKALALSAFGGVLTFLAFPEWDLFPFAWVCLVPLLAAVEGAPPRAAFVRGFVFGLVTNVGGFYWVVHLLVTFGHMPWVVSVLLFGLLAAYQGCLFAAFAALTRWIEERSRAPRVPVRVAAFVAVEFAVPFVFPWYLANSQWRFPLASQVCDLGGVLALSGVLAASSVLTWELIHRRGRDRRRPAVALAALVAFDLGYGALRLHQVDAAAAAAPKVRIGLVEANIGIREKAKPEHIANNLAIHQRLSRVLEAGGVDLVVWPESAYNAAWFPADATRIPPSQAPLTPDPRWDGIELPPDGHLVLADFPGLGDAAADRSNGVSGWDARAPQRGFSTPLLLGAITWKPDPDPPAEGPRWQRRVMNSAMLLDAQGNVGGRVYFKNYLLMFGEFIPFGRTFPWVYDLIPEASAFSAGTEVEVFHHGPLRAGVMICYEGILPRWTRRLVGKRPNVLLNITNDAWFGKRGEPWLHLALTTFRAIENRLPLVRATNTGISAFVDPAGRLVAHTSVEHAEVLAREVPLMEGGTVYRTVGDVLGWGALLAVAGLAVAILRRRRK